MQAKAQCSPVAQNNQFLTHFVNSDADFNGDPSNSTYFFKTPLCSSTSLLPTPTPQKDEVK